MNKKTLFSIRKLSVGIASVAIGGLLFVSTGHSVQAAEGETTANPTENGTTVTSGNENTDSTTSDDNSNNSGNNVADDSNTNTNPTDGENTTPNETGGDQSNDNATDGENTTPNETGEDSSNGNATDGENTTSDETGEDQSNEETSNQGTDSSVEGTTHKVAPGETIEGIAKENNTTVNQIVKDNGITDPDLVVAGTDLVINQPSSAHGVNNQATSDNSKASSNELPETGNSSGVNAGLTGGLALVAGAALVASRRRKEQE